MKFFFGEEILCEINDEIIFNWYFRINKVILLDEKICIFCYGEVCDYLFILCMGKNFKYILREGVEDFFVINDEVYVIYLEEGMFSDEGNLFIVKFGFIKIDIFIGEIIGLLDDIILEMFIDV